jgi:DNA ligase (NAD+)
MYSAKDQKRIFELSKQLLANQLFETSNPEEQVGQLIEVIQYHEWKYYIHNDPVISDFEYDTLFKKLEALEAGDKNLVRQDSPTQRVSSDLTADFKTVPHLEPMLSLANSYNAEDLKDFDTSIKKLTGLDGDIEYVAEPKFDGGSVVFIYDNDFLTRAATRGNGAKGDEMTNNARTLKSIPLKANFSQFEIQKVELRGEAVIRKDVFDKVNLKREKVGKAVFANPRNAATGGLRMKDPNGTAERGIEVFMFQMGYIEDQQGNKNKTYFNTHDESIEMLGKLGFKIPVQERKLCKNIEEVAEFCAMWQEKRNDYPYEIDGMVVKVNRIDLQEKCGSTSHHPRWAIAYKFKAKQATTKLINVEYQVGKIGTITPVAKLEPVQLAGVTVSSVSLHNEEFITSKDLRIGDTVLVERAGDVIPYIVKSFADLRDGSENKLEFPKYCPINTEEQVTLEKQEKEAAWRCVKCTCGAQDLQRMIFHVSKPAMNIDGFGPSQVERFHEQGWLKDIADIYILDYSKMSQLEGFGKRSAEKLEIAINQAKSNPIHRLLHSLSIHHLGRRASKLIAQRINHVMELKDWSLEDFTNINEIGPVVAENVTAFFKDPDNIILLEKMEERGVNLTQTEEDKPLEIAEDAPLIGKTILFTGSLQQMGRKEAQKIAENAGAKNISAVSSKLNILVVGEKAGSKLKKAQALGTVEILTEQAFIDLVNS